MPTILISVWTKKGDNGTFYGSSVNCSKIMVSEPPLSLSKERGRGEVVRQILFLSLHK